MHQLGEDDCILVEYLEDNGQQGYEEDVEQPAGIVKSLLHLKPIQTDAVIRSHASSHPIVECQMTAIICGGTPI